MARSSPRPGYGFAVRAAISSTRPHNSSSRSFSPGYFPIRTEDRRPHDHLARRTIGFRAALHRQGLSGLRVHDDTGKPEPVVIGKAEPLASGERGAGRSARTPSLLGTLRNARSQVELGMWRGRARRGRAGQAFELGGPDVVDGTTAKFIRCGLSRAAT